MSDTAEPSRSPLALLLAAAQDFRSSWFGRSQEGSWAPADLLRPNAPFPILEDLPSVADGWRLAAMAWRFGRAEYNYVQALAMGLATGCNEFVGEYMQRGPTEPSVPLQESMRRWEEVLDHSMQRTLRSKRYLDAQREVIRLSADMDLERQRLSKSMAALFGVPTERDLDEAYRRIHELKREVRALQRAERMKTRRDDNGQAHPDSENGVSA
jgi:Poly(R)-hydroxyalkanoic acid synthase subunit (PHA_synth_III_E)